MKFYSGLEVRRLIAAIKHSHKWVEERKYSDAAFDCVYTGL